MYLPLIDSNAITFGLKKIAQSLGGLGYSSNSATSYKPPKTYSQSSTSKPKNFNKPTLASSMVNADVQPLKPKAPNVSSLPRQRSLNKKNYSLSHLEDKRITGSKNYKM